MIHKVRKLLPKKEISSLDAFIEQAKKRGCTTITLKLECYREERLDDPSKETRVKFRVACSAHADEEEVAFFIKKILTYRPQGGSKKEIAREIAPFKDVLRRHVKKMQAEIKQAFPLTTKVIKKNGD